MSTRVAALRQYGQSIWLDFIRRSLITGGEGSSRWWSRTPSARLRRTPRFSRKAIDGGNDYAAAIEEISADPDLEPKAVYETLAIKDIQDAAECPASVV